MNYKLLYFPYYTMLDERILPFLETFLARGGTVIADEGFGLRDLNTWMRVGDINLKPLMTARLRERRNTLRKEEYVELLGEKTRVLPYKSEIDVENAEAISLFENGTPAIQLIRSGKGKIYLLGFSMGYTYCETEDKGIEGFFDKVMQDCGIAKYRFADFKKGIYEKRLSTGTNEIVFIFNLSDADKTVLLDGEIVSFGAEAIVNGSQMTVKAGGIGYAVIA